MLLLVLAAAALVGCEAIQTPSGPKAAGSPKMPPDYDLPESQFATAKFNTLASEFLDEYVGQYVVFEGRYMHHDQGALVWSEGRPQALHDFMTVMIGAPATSDGIATPRTVNVLWAVDDRELGRPFLNLQLNAPLKIYAYVLPANKQARVKSRQDRFMRGFPVPVVLLVKAVSAPSQ